MNVTTVLFCFEATFRPANVKVDLIIFWVDVSQTGYTFVDKIGFVTLHETVIIDVAHLIDTRMGILITIN
jgi:hypothetical protein